MIREYQDGYKTPLLECLLEFPCNLKRQAILNVLSFWNLSDLGDQVVRLKGALAARSSKAPPPWHASNSLKQKK